MERVSVRAVFAIKSLAAAAGGAERVFADIASGLAGRGYEIVVLTFDRCGDPLFYPLHPAIKQVRLGIGDARRRARPWETIRRIFALRKCIGSIGPAVVVAFMQSMFIPLGIALVGTGIPVIASEHNVLKHYKSRPLQIALLRLVYRLVRCITVVSKQAKGTYPSGLRKRMIVIPNPITLSPKLRAAVDGEGRSRKRLLAVGRLVPQKDHGTLVRAFSLISEDVPEWDLRIVGDGELRSSLDAQIASLGLGKRVVLPGATKDISSEYAAAQLFVVPSLYESFGLATVEAQAHGLPVVGFADCPGTNELIEHGSNGILVPPGDDRALALASTLRTVMLNTELRCKLADGAAVAAQFSLDTLLSKWEDALNTGLPLDCEEPIDTAREASSRPASAANKDDLAA